MPPRGMIGIPHGVLSSTDEWVALGTGLLALLAAVLYDGELDVRPVSGAASVGILVALVASAVAPAAVSNEWHTPVRMVVIVTGGIALARRRRSP